MTTDFILTNEVPREDPASPQLGQYDREADPVLNMNANRPGAGPEQARRRATRCWSVLRRTRRTRMTSLKCIRMTRISWRMRAGVFRRADKDETAQASLLRDLERFALKAGVTRTQPAR